MRSQAFSSVRWLATTAGLSVFCAAALDRGHHRRFRSEVPALRQLVSETQARCFRRRSPQLCRRRASSRADRTSADRVPGTELPVRHRVTANTEKVADRLRREEPHAPDRCFELLNQLGIAAGSDEVEHIAVELSGEDGVLVDAAARFEVEERMSGDAGFRKPVQLFDADGQLVVQFPPQ